MRYGSVCSGIEAASVAWGPLGWQPAWFAEIEAFPSAVLAHHWPHVENLGDMALIADMVQSGWVEAPDILVGGTPCQAFSVAGLREGLWDARGQLTLEFIRLANAIDEQREQPALIVWENVPGVLSSRDNAFGCFLAGLAGDTESITPGPAPERGKSTKFWYWSKKFNQHYIKWPVSGCIVGPERTVAWRMLDAQYFGVAQRRRRVFVVASARDGFDPTAVLFEFDGLRRDSAPMRKKGAFTSALTSRGVGAAGADDNQAQAGHLVIMAHGQGGAEVNEDALAPALTCNHEAPLISAIRENMAVRRLTPTECERLQGFPDGHTDVPYRNKPASDGPRHKALGNSMAVPCMHWIGARIYLHLLGFI